MPTPEKDQQLDRLAILARDSSTRLDQYIALLVNTSGNQIMRGMIFKSILRESYHIINLGNTLMALIATIISEMEETKQNEGHS